MSQLSEAGHVILRSLMERKWHRAGRAEELRQARCLAYEMTCLYKYLALRPTIQICPGVHGKVHTCFQTCTVHHLPSFYGSPQDKEALNTLLYGLWDRNPAFLGMQGQLWLLSANWKEPPISVHSISFFWHVCLTRVVLGMHRPIPYCTVP